MQIFRVLEARDEHLKMAKSWSEFRELLDKKNLLLSPFCGDKECEEKIKAESAREDVTEVGTSAMGAKSLCIPFEQVKS